MDPTTVMAVVCSVLVFAGWLLLPHSTTSVEPVVVVSDERQPVPVSA